MRYLAIEGVNVPVSRVIFGTAHPAVMDARDGEARKKAFALLDKAASLGITAIDMAHHYGEETVGAYLAAGADRDSLVLITKGGHHNEWRKRVTPYDIESDLMDSLAKLHTDRVDVYMLHRDDEGVPVGPIVETLGRLCRAGAIGAVGVSNWTCARIREANAYAAEKGLPPIRVSSPYYGLAEQIEDPWGGGCVSAAGPCAAGDRAFYRENGIPVIAYSALARGLFSGAVTDRASALERLDEPGARGYLSDGNLERLKRARSLAERKGISVSAAAIAYVLEKGDMDTCAVCATGSKEHLRDNAAAADIRLTKEECAWLDLSEG